MSILDPVGPLGTLAPEIAKKAPNLNLSRLARQESTPRIFEKFSRLFYSGRNPAWLAWSSGARVPRGPTGSNIDTVIVGLRPLGYGQVFYIFRKSNDMDSVHSKTQYERSANPGGSLRIRGFTITVI